MTPKYLTSDFQAYVLGVIRDSDREAADFFVRPPFLVDCSQDRARFEAEVSASARALLTEHALAGTRPSGEWPRRPVADYVQREVFSKARELDPATLASAQKFVDEWRSESGRLPGQQSKVDIDPDRSPVEVALPVPGVRVAAALFGLPGL